MIIGFFFCETNRCDGRWYGQNWKVHNWSSIQHPTRVLFQTGWKECWFNALIWRKTHKYLLLSGSEVNNFALQENFGGSSLILVSNRLRILGTTFDFPRVQTNVCKYLETKKNMVKLTSTTTLSKAGCEMFFIFPWLNLGALSARWRPSDWFDVLSTRMLNTEVFDVLWLISCADDMSTFEALPPVTWCFGSW